MDEAWAQGGLRQSACSLVFAADDYISKPYAFAFRSRSRSGRSGYSVRAQLRPSRLADVGDAESHRASCSELRDVREKLQRAEVATDPGTCCAYKHTYVRSASVRKKILQVSMGRTGLEPVTLGLKVQPNDVRPATAS
jgi:hypothetical protein